jgi:hypothetical protein
VSESEARLSVPDILLTRRSAIRIALLVVGVAAYQFLPATQASTTDDVTVIRFSWARSIFIAALAAWAGISSLCSAYKNDTEENRWQLAVFGAIFVGGIVYLVPGLLLSKVTIDPQAITFEDRRAWQSKTTTLDLANASSVQVRITTVPDHWTPRGDNTPRNLLLVRNADGSSKNAIDIGLLDPYGITALLQLSEKSSFMFIDERELGN